MPTFHILTPEDLAARDEARRAKSARTKALAQEQKPAPLPLDVQARIAYDAETDPARRWLAVFKIAIKGNLSPAEAARLANATQQAAAQPELVVGGQGMAQ